MTENFLQKLEERIVLLLSEVEALRKEIKHLNHENNTMRQDRETNSRRVQDLISLLESVNATDFSHSPLAITSAGVVVTT